MSEDGYSSKDVELHSMLRHDLKNKLQVAVGYLQLLSDTEMNEQQKQFVEKALNSLKESDQLISEVRNIRSIWDREGYGINLSKILSEVVEEYRPLAERKDIVIEVKGSDGKVIGSEMYKNLFSNLIDNSIKHSDCSKIIIRVNEGEQRVIVTVEDDGRGIPEGIKENLFEFGIKMGDNAGTGLGLSFVKEVVERYDGSIDIKESDLGGARFDIKFVKA